MSLFSCSFFSPSNYSSEALKRARHIRDVINKLRKEGRKSDDGVDRMSEVLKWRALKPKTNDEKNE
jgi:hypothetical protein